MLLNKGNLHWKFLQEHKPFHVSQLGFSAFISGLLLLLSQSLSVPLVHFVCFLHLTDCPQHLQCPSSIQHQNLLRNVFVETVSLPRFQYLHFPHLEFKQGASFKAFILKKKPHRLKTLRLTLLSNFSATGGLAGRAPAEQPPGTQRDTSSTTAVGEKKQQVRLKIKHFPLDEAIRTVLRKDVLCCLSNPSLLPPHLPLCSRNAVIMGKHIYVGFACQKRHCASVQVGKIAGGNRTVKSLKLYSYTGKN